jgi:hypothetical protein
MLAATLVGAGTTAFSAFSAANAEENRAEVEAQWAERRALEEEVSAQSEAGSANREARIAQSALTSRAAASGSRADDATVKDLWGDIGDEGRFNANMATARGAQQASGTRYQAALNQYSAKQSAKNKRIGGIGTLIGGVAGGASKYGSMSTRYSIAPRTTSWSGYSR